MCESLLSGTMVTGRYDSASRSVVMSGGFMVFVFTQILFLLNFRKSYIFGVNEVSEVIASLEVNDNRNER